jgi:hypothetical protein
MVYLVRGDRRMKRVVSTILLVILLTSMPYSAFKIMPAEAAGTIYVRADGSIDPPTAPITCDGNVHAQDSPSAGEIIINQSQNWYGDFTVNATDTVTIEDSDFTVVNGDIQIYGSLIVKNSTLWMRSNTLVKNIWVYGNSSQAGNLSILDSEFTGTISIYPIPTPDGSDSGSNIEILVHNSKMPATTIAGWGEYGTVSVSGSQLGQLYPCRQNCSYSVSNSSIDYFWVDFDSPFVSSTIENSSINNAHVGSPRGVDLELKTGFIQSLSGQNQTSGFSFALHNCSVNHWFVDNPGDVGLANSEIEIVSLMVRAPSVPLDLTFRNGSIQNYHLVIEQSRGEDVFLPIDLTIENTTIHDWDLFISEHNSTESTVRISDSNVSVTTFADNNLNLVISNSTMKFVQPAVRRYSMGSLNLTLLDSNVTSFLPQYSAGSMNLTLQEGHQDFINLYNQEEGSNVTIINSEISHWGFIALGNVRANIYNTTMTGQGELETYFSGDANVSICNSHLKRALARRNSFLSVIDSSIDQLTCYDNANVTLVNSTITTLIIDPVQVTLIGSRILSEIYSSLPIDFNTAFLEQPPAPLPDSIYGVGKCLHVTTSYEDIFDAQIRIYYDAAEMAERGISEEYLMMFCLEENSSSWRMCPIQGVNAGDNFVWTNVTSFSYFALGDCGSMASSGDINADGIVDIFDIVIVALEFGHPPPPIVDLRADVNKDGLVDIFDIVVVALHFGETG